MACLSYKEYMSIAQLLRVIRAKLDALLKVEINKSDEFRRSYCFIVQQTCEYLTDYSKELLHHYAYQSEQEPA